MYGFSERAHAKTALEKRVTSQFVDCGPDGRLTIPTRSTNNEGNANLDEQKVHYCGDVSTQIVSQYLKDPLNHFIVERFGSSIK